MADLNQQFVVQLKEIEREFDELNELLNSVEIMSDNVLFLYYKKRYDEISVIANKFKQLKIIEKQLIENEEILRSEEENSLISEFKEDIVALTDQKQKLITEIKQEIADSKVVCVEVAKVEISYSNGEKENLQVLKDLLKNYANQKQASINVIKQTETSYSCEITGLNSYCDLSLLIGNNKIINQKKESLFKVSVLKLVREDYKLNEDDIHIETLKSSGAGGQHINKTESAIRIVHIPTGINVLCQDERSQKMNRERAYTQLQEKLNNYYQKKQQKEQENQRKLIKNALFSTTPTCVFDFDKHKFIYTKTKKEYDISQILNGNLEIISRDII